MVEVTNMNECKISDPLVSIITATFNSLDFIDSVYESIKSQDYLEWEWVVTDDCSIDGTYEYLKKIQESDPKVRIYRLNQNSGAAVARNNSIEKSVGEFIAFIDSDDLWKPAKLRKQLKFMGDEKNFSFTQYDIVDAGGREIGKIVDLKTPNSVSYSGLLEKKVTLGCSTVILRRNAFGNLRMPLLRTGQDYAFWLSLLKIERYAYKLSEPLTSYRIHNNSISRNKLRKARRQWEIYRRIEKLPVVKSAYCFMLYALRAVFRS